MSNSKRILRIGVAQLPDLDPDTSYLTQNGFEDRLRQYRADGFNFIGIRACADVTFADGVHQSIYSGGLWGIESDSEESNLREVEAEELADLRRTLHEAGFSKRAIAAAIKENAELTGNHLR
jgi:hypothetical protein